MTPTEADLKLAEMKAQIVFEDQRRANNAAMAVAGTIAAMPQVSMPRSTNCNTFGYGCGATTTCY